MPATAASLPSEPVDQLVSVVVAEPNVVSVPAEAAAARARPATTAPPTIRSSARTRRTARTSFFML